MTEIAEKVGISEILMRKIIEAILRYKRVKRIMVFGSRACGKFKKTSDIDIAIQDENLTSKDLNLIRDILEENINTALKFDLVHIDSLKIESVLRDKCEKGLVIYEK